MARDAEAPHASGRLTVGLCYLVAICEGFDLQAAGVAAPRLGPALDLAPAELGWFFSASTFGLMLGAAVGGRLSDRFGRKRMIVLSVIVFGVMTLLTGLADSLGGLLAARFFTGVGIGAALPNLVALTSENAAPARRNLAVGLLYAGLPSGGALASFAALAGGADDWRTVFYLGGLAPIAVAPLLLWRLPESRELLTRAPQEAGSSPGRAAFGEGRARATVLLWVAFFLSLLTMYLLLNWLPTLLIGKGLARSEASLVQLSFNVLGALASVAAGLLMDHVRLSLAVVGIFAATAVSLLLLAGAPPLLAASMLVGGLVGMTMSATQTALYAMAPRAYPVEVRGTGVGAAVAVGRLGSAVGPLLAAALLAAGGTPQEVLVWLAPAILLSGLAAWGLTRALEQPAVRSRSPGAAR